jgi:hypothetical protein
MSIMKIHLPMYLEYNVDIASALQIESSLLYDDYLKFITSILVKKQDKPGWMQACRKENSGT